MSSAFPALSTSLSYLITRRKILILFVEVKPLLAYDLESSRKAVYDQIRKRVSQLYGGNYPHPQLFGISALGTRFCVYEYSTPLGRSHRVSTRNPTLLPTLRLRRDGILEPQGEARLKQVVRHINLEEMGWLPVPQVSLDFLTLRAQRSD